MKLFKLVLTGTAILMCAIAVCIKKTTGAAKQLEPANLQQKLPGSYARNVEVLLYPCCDPVYLPY